MKLAHIACAVAALLLAGGAIAQDGGKNSSKPISKTTISLGTATPGGGFPLYGGAFAEIMNAADSSLSIEPRTRRPLAIARVKSSRSIAAATCSAIGCCAPRWSKLQRVKREGQREQT